jgi:putative sigma-54 modulation protein
VRIQYNFRSHDEGESHFREHAEPRLEHLLSQYERVQEVRVSVASQRHWRTVDLTLEVGGALLRAEERNDDPLAAFDKALARLTRQLQRFKDRAQDFSHDSLRRLASELGTVGPTAEPDADQEAPSLDAIRIVRTKTHTLKPMTPEEAVLQMEMLGHDFFVFVDGAGQRVGVVYKRRDGGYGLIEPGISS